MVTIIPRTSWTTSPWAGTTYTVPPFVRTEFMIHYEGGTPTSDTGAAAMRGIDRVHRGNGWAGIGYNFVVMQDGSIWEGRGWRLVGAHCPGHNRVGIGVQVHIGGDQIPTNKALTATLELRSAAIALCGRGLRTLGHRDGYATECPGDQLEFWLRQTNPSGPVDPVIVGPRVTAAPPFPLPTGWYFGPEPGPRESVSGYHGHRGDLRTWQARMHLRGWDITADGLYGPVTAAVARHFQREKGLHPDALIGPQTWGAAWTAPVT